MQIQDQAAAPQAATPPPIPVIAIANPEAGTGKTTITFNLAAAIARQMWIRDPDARRTVVMIDCTPTQDLSRAVLPEAERNAENKIPLPIPVPSHYENLFILPAGNWLDLENPETNIAAMFRLKRWLNEINDASAVLIDTPPTKVGATQIALAAATHLLIPFAPDDAGINAADTIRWEYSERHFNPDLKLLGLVINDTERGNKKSEAVRQARRIFDHQLLVNEIYRCAENKEAIKQRQAVCDLFPQSKLTQQYHQMACDVLFRLKQTAA